MKLRVAAMVAVMALVAGCGKGGEQQKPAGEPVKPATEQGAQQPAQPAEGTAQTGEKPADPASGPVTFPSTGVENPKVEIFEVSEFQCPFCSRVLPTIKQIKDTYGDQVRVTFLHQPLPFHKDARPAAIASMAAWRQGKFWEMHDKLFANQRALSQPELEKYAQEVGLDMEKYKKDVADPEIAKFVDRNQAIANAVGASGTPAFFINGQSLRGAQPFEQFKQVIDAEIKAADDAGKRGMDYVKERTKTNNAQLAAFVYEGKEPPAAAPAAQQQQPRPVDRTVYKVDVDPGDAMKGNAKGALVTIVEFSDFQCPFCSRLNPVLDQIMSTYGDKVRVVFKHNPLPFHKEAFPAAEASMCANDQGKFWEMHDKLFANMRALQPADLERYAGEVGLNVADWKKCMDSNKHKARIEADQELAGKVTARGTPNSFVNGRKLTGAKPFEEFKELIDEELKKAEELVGKGTAREDVYAAIIKDGKVFEPLEEQVNQFDLSKTAVMGKPTAKIQIVEFSDFQCPFCARVGSPLKEVQKHYGDQAVIGFKHFPLNFHKEAFPAAEASLCANDQGKFWEMHDKLFEVQKDLAQAKWDEWAKEAGVKDIDAFKKCMESGKHKDLVNADMEEGRKAGVRGTPTIYINGRKFTSPSGYNLEAFTRVIDKHILNKK